MSRALGAKLIALVALAVLGFIGYTAMNALRGGSPGRIVVVQDVPDDVRAELDTTWRRFLERFAGRRDCFDDVTVLLVDDVDGGDARYVGDASRIEVQIPTTPARFRESVAHELGHHLERTCEDFGELREVLLGQFAGVEQGWTEGRTWEETPSELWAETVVEIVNGERLLHGDQMPIDRSVVEIVGAWGRGESVAQ